MQQKPLSLATQQACLEQSNVLLCHVMPVDVAVLLGHAMPVVPC